MKGYPYQPEVLHLVTESINVEIPMTTGQQSYSIRDTQLSNVNIVGMFARSPLAGRKTKSNLLFASNNVYQAAFLSIKEKNVDKINSLPIEYLNTVAGEYVPVDLPNGINIDDAKIYVADPTITVTGTAIELVFIITRPTC
jgi:hypothetical protein